MGFFKRKVKKTVDLHETGVRGTARIDELEMLNRGEFQVSASPEELMSGEASVIRVKLRLTVDAPGHGTYDHKMKVQVPMMEFTKLGVGGTVPVVVDPEDQDHLEIDWDGDIIEPTLEERAQVDPVLKEMLDRRVDPD